MSPIREMGPSARSRAATRVNAVRTAGWLLGHDVAFGRPTSKRVPSASAWYGRGTVGHLLQTLSREPRRPRGGERVRRRSTPAREGQDPRGGARRPDRSELGDAGEEPVGLGSVPTVQLTEQLGVDPASFSSVDDHRPTFSAAPTQSRSDDDVPQLHGRR